MSIRLPIEKKLELIFEEIKNFDTPKEVDDLFNFFKLLKKYFDNFQGTTKIRRAFEFFKNYLKNNHPIIFTKLMVIEENIFLGEMKDNFEAYFGQEIKKEFHKGLKSGKLLEKLKNLYLNQQQELNQVLLEIKKQLIEEPNEKLSGIIKQLEKNLKLKENIMDTNKELNERLLEIKKQLDEKGLIAPYIIFLLDRTPILWEQYEKIKWRFPEMVMHRSSFRHPLYNVDESFQNYKLWMEEIHLFVKRLFLGEFLGVSYLNKRMINRIKERVRRMREGVIKKFLDAIINEEGNVLCLEDLLNIWKDLNNSSLSKYERVLKNRIKEANKILKPLGAKVIINQQHKTVVLVKKED